MQVTETQNEGLKRALKITVPMSELNERLNKRINQLKGQVQLRGFRPGKVPEAHIKKLYGRSAMAEIVETVVLESSKKVIDERAEKPAMQPNYKMTEDEAEAGKIIDGKADLEFDLEYEVLPSIELMSFSEIEIERPITDVSDEEIEKSLKRIADSNRPFEARADDESAQDGDKLSLDFVGRIDGEPFEGGSGDGIELILGAGDFIPGFEEQLMGAKSGEERLVKATFPEEYQARNLAGREAEFDVTVKAVTAPTDMAIDDELAKLVGLESLDALKKAIREQVESQNGQFTRQKVKRQILDKLDEIHHFELPPTLVEQEFDQIWKQLQRDMEATSKSFEDDNTNEEAAKEEYRKIAERRVRLGLVLAEIGEKNKIQVNEEEVQRAVFEQARQYPGQENVFFEFIQKNPERLASIRAPIFEEKIIDFILELAKVQDKAVSKDELMAQEDD